MNFADVPNTLMRSDWTKSNSILAFSNIGAPSKSTTVAPLARPETSQFHIIQPQVVK